MRDKRSVGGPGESRRQWRQQRARQMTRRAAAYVAEALEDRQLLSSITGFANFTLNGADGLGTNGSATTDNNRGAAPALNGTTDNLTLTTTAANEASSLWYNAPVSYQNFTASFSYYAFTGTTPSANGMAFVLQNDPRGLHAIGGGGGDLGYSTDSYHPATAIANSVALELDIFNGSLTGIATGGGGMTQGQSTGRVNLAQGYTIVVVVSYDSASQTLSENLTDTTTGLSYSTSFANLNLDALLGGSTAYVGFTGGTGADDAEQHVYNFGFATHPSPPPPSGTAVGFADFALNGANGAGIDGSAPQDNNHGAAPTLSADQNTLTLTTASANQASSAFTTAQLPYHNFTATFTYQQSGSTSPGNGFAFVLQLDGRGANALGGGGENLGDGTDASHPATAISSSFAVEFNVYQVSSTAIGTNGSTSSLPTLGGNTGSVDLRSGNPIDIALSYNDSTLIETLTDADTHATYTTSYAGVNVPWTLGYGVAYIGFTGGTGGAAALQTISDFTFTPYTSVPPAPPPPGPISGFANFTPNQEVNWYGGGPTVSADENTLTITPQSSFQANSAIFNAAVPYRNFTASFTYQASGSSAPADGFTFMLENDPRDVNAVAGSGGQLGYGAYGANPGTPISPSFAAEFNIYQTSSISADSDGYVSVPHNLSNTGPVSLSSGDPIAVTLSYNSVTNTLYETLIDGLANARYAVAFANVNLAATLGGSTAYLGFTGGTGGNFATQTISNFTFQTSATVPPVPAPPAPVNSVSGFYTFDQDGLFTNPAGAPTVAPTVLTLTTAVDNEAATAFSNTPVTYGDFTASFHYYDTGGGATAANGFTFALEQTPVLGGAGGNLGYSPKLPNSFAVEFNVYQGSSVTIGAGGSLSVPGGVSNTGGVNLASGDEILVSIAYHAASQTLDVDLSDVNALASYSTSFGKVDLRRILGGGPAAYVGFTGATGGAGASQQVIAAFSYSASAPQPPAPAVPQVSLGGDFNAYGIGNVGSPAVNGGYDGVGDSLAAAYFGPSQTITLNGIPQTFDFGPAGAPDIINADGQTINLPPGKYASLSLIGAAAYGSQLAQPFTVLYADGSSQTFTQGFSDWFNGATLPGQAVAIPMTYFLNSSGTQGNAAHDVYDYQFATDPAKTVQSLTFPNDTRVKILAINVNELPAVTAVMPQNGPAAGGTTVTITGTGFAGATGVSFGGTAASSFTVNSDSSITAVDPAGSGAVDVTVTGPGGTSAITAADRFTYVPPPPALAGKPVINGDDPNRLFNAAGQGATPGVQRSMVEDIVYTFNEPVLINDANAAFTVQVAGSQGIGTVPSTLTATAVPGSNGTGWAVSLTGQAEGTLASIANGEYSITINPAFVFAAADGTTAMNAGETDTFYRLYGDINGDRIVNNADNLQFRRAQVTYNPALDANADGFINNADNLQLRRDQAINFFSDGFVTSI